MRKSSLQIISIISFFVLLGSYHPLYAQQVKEVAASYRAALLEKGKKQRTSGIVCTSIGAALLTACIALPDPKPRRYLDPIISSEKAITGVGGFVFTTIGIINLTSGISNIHGAKVGLGKTSYYLHPKQSIQGPSFTLQLPIGK